MAKDLPDKMPRPAGTPSEAVSARQDIDRFLDRARNLAPPVAPGERGRLMFALDATMSRQPTWDTACRLQAEMFRETGQIGGLDIQLIYFRGFGECRASSWVSASERLADLMTKIDCRGGHTQIGKILSHAKKETQSHRVQAVVFIGDAMEEAIDDLSAKAGELGLLGVPVFAFQEGNDAIAERAFREIARLSHGVYCRFDVGAAHQLAELLRASALYAAGGIKALTASEKSSAGARKLLAQLR